MNCGVRLVLRGQLKSACLIKIVTLEKAANIGRFKVTDNIGKPNADPWYLIECNGHLGATFFVVYDGDKWHPVSGKWYLLRGINKKSMGNHLAVSDKELFDKLIEEFHRRMAGNRI